MAALIQPKQEEDGTTQKEESTELQAAVKATPQVEQKATKAVKAPTPTPPQDDHLEKPAIAAANWQVSHQKVCQGETVDWSISAADSKDLIVLLNDRKIDTKKKSFTFNKAGSFELALARKVDKKWRKLDTKKITVHANGGADFTYDKQKDYKAPVVAFNSSTSNPQNKWYIDEELVSEDAETSYLFRNKGRYSVKLVTENENGCKDSSVQTIRILRAYNLMASAVFNPEKEKWMPIGLKGNKNKFELQVLNPNGEVVFTSNDANKEWDGSDLNSAKQKAPNGEMYLWVARVTEANGMVMEYGGSVLVSYYDQD
ncbi:hypothetical protein KFE98_10995 [bacterium SCSIO 12741]|nr:hypothetical protein KFE98_10995 [bacterium SCSIO 12741]